MAYVGKVGTSFFIGTQRPAVVAQMYGVKVEAAYVEPVQLTAYPTLCPLTVTKVVDPPGPKQPGEVVTITIRYANTGAKAVSDIVVSDSLSGRLEYIPGRRSRTGRRTSPASDNEVGLGGPAVGVARHDAPRPGGHDQVQGEGAVGGGSCEAASGLRTGKRLAASQEHRRLLLSAIDIHIGHGG